LAPGIRRIGPDGGLGAVSPSKKGDSVTPGTGLIPENAPSAKLKKCRVAGQNNRKTCRLQAKPQEACFLEHACRIAWINESEPVSS
jgi:hypothetical protein